LTFPPDHINVGILYGKWKRSMSEKIKRPEDPADIEPGGKIDFEEVRKVIALLEEKNLSALELEVEGLKIKISRGIPSSAAPTPVLSASAPTAPPAGEAGAPAGPSGAAEGQDYQLIASPMVGTFYRAPDPTADPFVDIGDPVKKGQTLCIIEAMKLMNEIESDVDGTVVDIFAENAKPVEYGQKLFAIRPAS
jgi:acetyl-CoA carboxylase biotin carboxyl carrier protein